MRQLGYVVTVLLVMGLAFWAYRENYRTQSQIGEMMRLRTEIAALRERLGLLHAEWAWLNRPERLRELVDLNFERLSLIPLVPEHFITVPQIAYPAPTALAPPAEDDVLTGAGEPLPGTPAGAVVPRPPARPRPALPQMR